MFSAASVCLFVSLFVCQHDNFRTIKGSMMKVGGQVHCTKISPEFEFGGQRSKVKVTRDTTKTKNAAFFGSGPWGLACGVCLGNHCPPFYAGGKISACCLVFKTGDLAKVGMRVLRVYASICLRLII